MSTTPLNRKTDCGFISLRIKEMKELVVLFVMIFATLGARQQVLYKVSGNGAKGDSYVMGTHHFAPSSMLNDINGFEAALNGVEAVYGEVEEGELNEEKVQELAKKYGEAPSDSTLSKVLTPDQFSLLDEIVKKYTNNMLTADQLNTVTPSIVGMQILAFQTLAAFPEFNPADQIDTKIQKMCKEQKKSTGGLETAEEQMKLLFGAPISIQAASLVRSLSQDMNAALAAKRLAELYAAQDVDGMLALMNDPMLGMTSDEAARMIFNRNDNWMRQIPSLIAEKPIMFVVGAGHLPGERGLLALLKKAGYEVTPVK